jgi:DNA-binding MarR family transcriptional regulator
MANKEPDLAILLAASARALADELGATMDRAGYDVRPAFGFVIRAVAAEEPTLGRLAEILGVTKQAASQLADEVEAKGFIQRVPHPDDRRSRRLVLTPTGRDVRKRALTTSGRLERHLVRAVGEDAVKGCRATLLALLARTGDIETVNARRARMPW